MIYLYNLNKADNNNFKVNGVHYMPFDEVNGLGKTKDELEKTGVFIDYLPEPETLPGKVSILKYNDEVGVYYDYVDVDPTLDKRYEDLLEKYNVMQSALDELIMGGGF